MSMKKTDNSDLDSVKSFGDEWKRFDQQRMSLAETERLFSNYFDIFPWHLLPPDAEGFDMGCGSGRWARFVAPRVGLLHCIDPSAAIEVARDGLKGKSNVQFHNLFLENCGLPTSSQDFGYSLGVLHHVPNTTKAIRSCVELLKPGAPLLLYLYYAFDNRPKWFQILWRLSNLGRLVIHKLRPGPKQLITDLIALFIYLPLARMSKLIESLGLDVDSFPLSYYRNCSFFTMRTDSRDRFGTPLEQRFTRIQIIKMCEKAGLEKLRFSSKAPYWCVIGIRAEQIDD